jgi:raffinose/stachyose/melibiose transport system permease protein
MTSEVMSSAPRAAAKSMTGHERRRGPSRPRVGKALSRLAVYAFLGLSSVIVLLPLVSIFSVSLQPAGTSVGGLQWPADPQWGNYIAAWTTGSFSRLMLNSLIVAVVVVPVAVGVSVLAGYAFGTMKFRGSNVLFYVFLIGLVMPFESTVVPLYYNLRSLGLVNTHLGVILPQIALYTAFGVFWMRSFFRSTPMALIEAARIDGASSVRVLWSVLLPLARPAILTLATLYFIWSWNEFLLSLVVLTSPEMQTAPAGLGLFVGERLSDIPGLSAGAIIISIPTVILYVILNRKIISGILQGAVKG